GPLPARAHDVVTSLARASFDQFAFTDDDIDFLRAYAKAYGTYVQGAVDFDSHNPLPNGLVFVDTQSGTNIAREGTASSTPSSDFARVSILGGAAADPSGIFNGWLFVNGTLTISGAFAMQGLLYVQDDLSYRGAGAIRGAVISASISNRAPSI